MTTEPQPAPDFRSVHSTSMPALLDALGGSLAVTTYQSGRLIFLRRQGEVLNTHFRSFPSPMGLALGGPGLALGTARDVRLFRNQPQVAQLKPDEAPVDACFVPTRIQITGDVRIHEMAWEGERLVFANTRFSCLATLSDEASFEPIWQPSFIGALAAEDRCHLNGLAMRDGRVALVSALGTGDSEGSWRERKADGGVLLDVASGEVVAHGLSMPHSPRFHDGRCFVLESGKGTLATVDLRDGRIETVCTLPGFTRGLALAGPFAFVGLSKVREKTFDGIPLAASPDERVCGVYAVDLRSGGIAGLVRFEGSVEEIFDVQFLAGMRFPDLLDPTDDAVANAFFLSDAALARVAAADRPQGSG